MNPNWEVVPAERSLIAAGSVLPGTRSNPAV